MIIGGIAVIARGVRRMTTDIDAVVQGDAISIDTLVTTLAEHGIVKWTPSFRPLAGRVKVEAAPV